MDFSHALMRLLARLMAGVTKFVLNSLRAGRLAFGLIGYSVAFPAITVPLEQHSHLDSAAEGGIRLRFGRDFAFHSDSGCG